MSALYVIVTTLRSFLISLKQFKVDKAVEKVNFSFPILFSCRILTATHFSLLLKMQENTTLLGDPLVLPVVTSCESWEFRENKHVTPNAFQFVLP